MAELLETELCDVDEQARALPGWEQSYEQLDCGRFHGSVRQLLLRDGGVLRETTNRRLREEIVPPPDQVVLAVPLAVQPGSVFAGRAMARDALMVLGGGRQVDIVSTGELDLIGLVAPRALADRLAPQAIDWLARAESDRLLALTPATAQAIRAVLASTVTEAQACIVGGQGEPDGSLAATALERLVALAMADTAAGSAPPVPRRAHARQLVVRRAIEFMRANLHAEIGVPEICAAAYTSRRSLQYCFEEFVGTSPQACLRALRLNAARRQLKSGGERPITLLATELGFSSASHFSRHYRLMFDELPSATARARAQAAALA